MDNIHYKNLQEVYQNNQQHFQVECSICISLLKGRISMDLDKMNTRS